MQRSEELWPRVPRASVRGTVLRSGRKINTSRCCAASAHTAHVRGNKPVFVEVRAKVAFVIEPRTAKVERFVLYSSSNRDIVTGAVWWWRTRGCFGTDAIVFVMLGEGAPVFLFESAVGIRPDWFGALLTTLWR